MLDLSKLKDMGRDELVELAVSQGVNFHHRAGAETISKAIIEQVTKSQAQPPKTEQPQVIKRELEMATLEKAQAVVEKIKESKPNFIAEFPNDGTWVFRCNGAEDSGNLDIPLAVIKQKAENVSRGRLVLLGVTNQFDTTNYGGTSAYANTVLSA